MRLRPLFIVASVLAFALAACEIHTGDGTQPATPAATTAAPATTTPPPPQEHLSTGHVILKTDGGA